jgi:hypothetical protein
MTTPRTPAGRALLRRLDQMGAMAFSSVSYPGALDDILAIEAEAQAAPDALLREALARAGFTPDSNVCASCGHHGSEHDLANWCLTCPRPEWDRTAKSPAQARIDAGWCFFASPDDHGWAAGLTKLNAALTPATPPASVSAEQVDGFLDGLAIAYGTPELRPATPPASAIQCWHGGQEHAWEPGESCPPTATPPASAERDA